MLGVSRQEWEILSPHLSEEKWPLTFSTLFAWLGSLAFLGQAYFLSQTLGLLVTADITSQPPGELLTGFLAFLLLKMFCSWMEETLSIRAITNIRTGIRKRILEKLAQQQPPFFQDQRSGELIHLVTAAMDALDLYLSQYLQRILLALLIPISYLLIMAGVDFLSAFLLFLTAPLLPLFQYMIGRSSEKMGIRQWNAMARLNARFFDMLQGLCTWKVFQDVKKGEKIIRNLSEDYRRRTMHILRVAFLSTCVTELLATMSIAIVAVAIGLRLLHGQMHLAPGFFILLVTPAFFSPLRHLGSGFHSAVLGRELLLRMREILLLTDQEGDGSGRHDGIPPPEEIRLQDVSFHYPSGKPVVERLCLLLQRERTYVVCGPSGCGKTTLLHLLLGFLQPTQGEILLDSVSLTHVAAAEWIRHISYLPQRPYIFYGSVLDNLRLANPDAGMDEMQKGLEMAGLQEWIRELPQGIHTMLGERGFRLSGGEMQRMALARIFLKKASIVLLDEPSEGLDPELEEQLRERIETFRGNRILVWVTHRREVAPMADQVLFFQSDGSVAQGPHFELLEKNKEYRCFYGEAGGQGNEHRS